MDSGLPVWDRLWEAGRECDMIAAGMGAFDSLRLEKGYRLWGTDIHTEYTPDQAGLGWTVKLAKPEFIGRAALLAARKQEPTKKLCCLTLSEPQAVLLGYEPIFADDRCVGYVTSANYGYSVGTFIAYGYLPLAHAQPGTRLEIEYFDRRFSATVSAEPLYDPTMERMKV
jgi:glycine cleavage system aminomethyltransferase T